MREEFEDWLAGAQSSLLAYARLVCGDREEARDVVQSVLGRMAPRATRLRHANPDAYARRAVVNEVISQRRKHRPPTVALVAEPAVVDGAERVPDRVLAWQLCDELPPQQRAAVVLRFFEDADYARIADVLGTTEGTARTHVHRALAALRTRIEKEDLG